MLLFSLQLSSKISPSVKFSREKFQHICAIELTFL